MDVGPAAKAEAAGGPQDILRHSGQIIGDKGRIAGPVHPELARDGNGQKGENKGHRHLLPIRQRSQVPGGQSTWPSTRAIQAHAVQARAIQARAIQARAIQARSGQAGTTMPLLTASSRIRACSFSKARTSIWRMRSRLTP